MSGTSMSSANGKRGSNSKNGTGNANGTLGTGTGTDTGTGTGTGADAATGTSPGGDCSAVSAQPVRPDWCWVRQVARRVMPRPAPTRRPR